MISRILRTVLLLAAFCLGAVWAAGNATAGSTGPCIAPSASEPEMTLPCDSTTRVKSGTINSTTGDCTGAPTNC